MRIKQGFVLREVCGENVIVGEGLGAINFGKLLALNESAAWLWKQAQEMGDFTVEALTERLCEAYDVAPTRPVLMWPPSSPTGKMPELYDVRVKR